MRGKPRFKPKNCIVCKREYRVGRHQGRQRHAITCSKQCTRILNRVRTRIRERTDKYKKHRNIWQREYRKRSEIKVKLMEYRRRPEVMLRHNENRRKNKLKCLSTS